MPEIPPVGRPQRADNNPNKPKTPEERVEVIKDRVELSEVAKLNLELEKAKEELKLLPSSEFWLKRIILLKSKIEHLEAGQK
jgi:hypothetical protein